MEEQIILKSRVENKKNILTHPDLYTDTPMLCLVFPREYLQALINYSAEHDMSRLEITIAEWPIDPTERAKKFFFTLRDRICETSGDTSREYKDHIYRSVIEEFKFMKEGKVKNSIKDLDKRELWLVTEKLMDNATAIGAYIGDLIPDYKSSQADLKG